MRLKSALSTFAAVASLAIPAFAETAAQSAARDSLIAFNDRFNELAASHDAEGLVALYDENTFWIAPATPPAQGRDGVPLQTITFMSENKGDLSHTIEDLFISDDGTQAVMKGVTRASVESQGFRLEGSYIYVLERENADAPWRILLDMFSNYAAE
ncbi:ketosteroid isomerase-like protein [Aliiruegeria haliotis]|uniref:Ketosteroid isomerase-like protein n=1 Tax=Aliiruegeria haliotis TaxID=1280846 RepID=A0A2T0RH45_9RHOB|nr:nuclear transport factor 2 family protein [Aliiruegeria haliotis]PRY20526.1 ketosteroid isomerase-like protein [Aliiruegeria haliotis]